MHKKRCLVGRTWFGIIFVCSIFTLSFSEQLRHEDQKTWMESMALALNYPKSLTDQGTLPSEYERELLNRFRPRVFVAPGGQKPIDFYRDYLPHTSLRKRSDGKRIEKSPSRARLKELSLETDIYLDFEGNPKAEVTPVSYGRLYDETVNVLEEGRFKTHSFTFLKYNFVFLYGGLPAMFPTFKEKLAGFLGDPSRWCELDVHAAVHVVLDENKEVIALILAQHQYHRTYLSGIHFELPADGRVLIAFSERSNQPYLLPLESSLPVQRRAVLDVGDLEYLLMGSTPPFLSGVDLVYSVKAGAAEVEYELEFLDSLDPLYVVRFSLGAVERFPWRREIPLRRGSVGMDFATWPQLIDLGNLMQFWYLEDGNEWQTAFMKYHARGFYDVDFGAILLRNGALFGRSLYAAGAKEASNVPENTADNR